MRLLDPAVGSVTWLQTVEELSVQAGIGVIGSNQPTNI